MTDTIYTIASAQDMPDVIDFINYIFSQTHVPHDFKRLLPKVYADDAPEGRERFHHIAKQNGRIVGCVALRPTKLIFGESELNCGYVGSVSVHPYHRGEGHMKRLMSDVTEDAKQQSMDMLILGGQRQRYEYFGFEYAGLVMEYVLTKTNIRHALSNLSTSGIEIRPMEAADIPQAYEIWRTQPMRAYRQPNRFLAELKSWTQTPLCLIYEGKTEGYIAGREIVLAHEDMLARFIKAIMEAQGPDHIDLKAALHEKQRMNTLSNICEHEKLANVSLINVLNWPNVLKALIEFKHNYVMPVADTKAVIDIQGDGCFEIEVRGGKAQASKLDEAPENAIKLTHTEAEQLFFGISNMYLNTHGMDAGLTGLPFYMSSQDSF